MTNNVGLFSSQIALGVNRPPNTAKKQRTILMILFFYKINFPAKKDKRQTRHTMFQVQDHRHKYTQRVPERRLDATTTTGNDPRVQHLHL